MAAVVTVGLAACSSGGDEPATPSDPVLAEGQQVYNSNCASCHGRAGNGGIGAKLAGVVSQRYEDIDDQIAVIANGKGGMPPFEGRLSEDQIEAVARYTREVL